MVCKNRGIYGFLGTLWVLITMPPLINSTASHGDRQKKTNKQKRYPGCPAHAVIGVFYSIVANRRQPSLYIYVCIYKRGLRRGGLTPALAPRMPVITEYVRIEAAIATVLPRGTLKMNRV